MQHASLASIGRRATIEVQDSLTDSFEKRNAKEPSSQSPDRVASRSGNVSPSSPRVLRLDEVLHHLRTVDRQLRELHASRHALPLPIGESSSVGPWGRKSSMNDGTSSSVRCCRRLGEFVRAAKRAVELHVALVRRETFNSALVELSQSVDQMVEQEYANVSAGATSLMKAFTRSDNGRGNLTAKTRMSSVRGICEGLRQGLSLVSRTNTLLANEFAELAPPPPSPHWHTLLIISVLIAASHIVNAGLLLLSQSDLTRYTHAELWEITRGMEELSMLTERVQEQLDERKQSRLRRLLLDKRPFSSASKPLEQRLSELSLLTDPIDSLRPSSVGHIIYLLARYRSSTLAHTMAGDLLQALRGPARECGFLSELVRKEYEFCSNFLDVMTQSTELLRNLRRIQETVDSHPKSILHRRNPVESTPRINSRVPRKPIHMTKTESIDKFISAFPDKPSRQAKSSTPIEEGDEDGGEKQQKKIVHWSDYYEVALRHRVVGRYLQLTWIGLSEELDRIAQLVIPTDLTDSLKISPPWPMQGNQEIRQMVARIQEFGSKDGLPLPLKRGIQRQAERLRICADMYDWFEWNPGKWVVEADDADLFCTPLGNGLKNIFNELLKHRLFNTDDLMCRLAEVSRNYLGRLELEVEAVNRQSEFSHRLLRLHLDQFFRMSSEFLAEVLRECVVLLADAQHSLESTPPLVEYIFKASRQLDLLLSLLTLLRTTLDYFTSLRKALDTPQLIADIVSSKFEERYLTFRLMSLEALISKAKEWLRRVSKRVEKCAKPGGHLRRLLEDAFTVDHRLASVRCKRIAACLCRRKYSRSYTSAWVSVCFYLSLLRKTSFCPKDGRTALHAAHSRFWRSLASQQPLTLQQAIMHSKSPDVAEVDKTCEVFGKILESLPRLGFSGCATTTVPPSDTTEANGNETRCWESNAKLAATIAESILLCLERGLLVNVEITAIPCLGSLQRLLAKLLSLVEQVETGPDNEDLLARGLSLHKRLQPHSSTTLSTLETLSANVRAYFQNEDIVSRPPGSQAKGPPNRRS